MDEPIFVKLTLLDDGHDDSEGQLRLAVAAEYTPGLSMDFVANLLYTAALELAPRLAGVTP